MCRREIGRDRQGFAVQVQSFIDAAVFDRIVRQMCDRVGTTIVHFHGLAKRGSRFGVVTQSLLQTSQRNVRTGPRSGRNGGQKTIKGSF